MLLAEVLAASGRDDEALALLGEVVRSDATHAPARVLRGLLRLGSSEDGSAEAACLDFEEAARLDVRKPLPSLLCALAQCRADLLDAATATVRDVLDADPDCAPALTLDAWLALSTGELESAAAAAAAAAERVTDDGCAALVGVVAIELGGRTPLARKGYASAERRHPESPWLARAAAILAEREGRLRDAVRAYERVSEIRRLVARRLGGARPGRSCCAARRSSPCARCARAVDVDPEHKDAWLQLGSLLHRHTKQKRAAREAYRSYLALGGKDKRVAEWLDEID